MAKYNRKKFMTLKLIMMAKNYTQEKLAKELGIAEYTLNMKLNGRTSFTVPEADEICKILEIQNPIDVFFEPRLH